jgi:probable addiction module antidote protein
MEEKQMTKTAPYDSAEFLDTPKAVKFYIEEAMESGDPQLISHALGVVARAKSMSDIAQKSGMSRESLYRSLSPTGKPEFSTVMNVLKALGLGLSVHTVSSPPKRVTSRRVSNNKKAGIAT